VVIDWPVDMDLPEAVRKKVEADCTNPFATVSLRHPLGPKLPNPFFIFGSANGPPYIFVDTVTGEVTSVP
jgi:hypothetical protein